MNKWIGYKAQFYKTHKKGIGSGEMLENSKQERLLQRSGTVPRFKPELAAGQLVTDHHLRLQPAILPPGRRF